MKLFATLVVTILVLLAAAFSSTSLTKSQSRPTDNRRLEFRMSPFADLYFFVYKLSSASEKAPGNEAFAQAVEAARQLPLVLTLIDKVPFELENAAAAEKLFTAFPETHKTRQGEIVAVREKATRFGQSLVAVEKRFMETVWPQHKVMVQQSMAQIERTLLPKEKESFDYFIRHLGMGEANAIVPVYLVAETPWPGGFTMWGKEATRGVCVISVTAYRGSSLVSAVLHEAIHALDLETKGNGNVLVELRERLLKAGIPEDDMIVRHGPHLLVFIQSSETVRRLIDSSYEPYKEGVFVRPGLQPLVNVELPIWTAYLDGKISRAEALDQMVAAFVKMRKSDAALLCLKKSSLILTGL